jgi:hypothetical protein
MRIMGIAMATVPRRSPRLHASALVVQNLRVLPMTMRSVIKATDIRIGTRVQVSTPRTIAALVSTADEPHPRLAATSGVQGLIVAS